MSERLSVLLVESSPADAALVIEELDGASLRDFEILWVRSLEAASAQLEEEEFDVVLLELGLPGSDGLTTMLAAHAIAPDTPIVVLAGGEQPDLGTRVLRANAQEVLHKGQVDGRGTLCGTVCRAVARHRAQRGLVAGAPILHTDQDALREALQRSPDGLVVIDGDGVVLFANKTAVVLLDADPSTVVGRQIGLPTVIGGTAELTVGGRTVIELRFVETRWDGAPAFLGTLRDVTRQSAREETLRKQARELRVANEALRRNLRCDALTGLANRRGLASVLGAELRRTSRQDADLTLLLLDLDGFSRIAETVGHGAADRVLSAVGKRLQAAVRPTDTVARFGRDEFGVLLPDTRLVEGLLVAEKLRECVAEAPFSVGLASLNLTASAGVVSTMGKTESLDAHLKAARFALRRGRLAGRDPAAEAGTQGAIEGEAFASVVRALAAGQRLQTLAQPIVHLSGERVVGFKLLTRSTISGFERPDDFFAVARDADMLSAVDYRCFSAAAWAAANLAPGLRCHLCLFPSTLLSHDPSLLVSVLGGRQGTDTVCLELSAREIVGDPADLRAPVAELRSRGLRIGLTDLGFGRSSLESLVLLEPDLVKINRSRVRHAGTDAGQRRILARLVSLARATGAEVMAVGIETVEDLEVLRDLGVRLGQGHLFGRPEPVEASPEDGGDEDRAAIEADEPPSPLSVATA